jgi:hypothetical protein
MIEEYALIVTVCMYIYSHAIITDEVLTIKKEEKVMVYQICWYKEGGPPHSGRSFVHGVCSLQGK